MPEGLTVALIGLAGAVIGSVATLSADIIRRRSDERLEKKSVAYTISGVIQANIDIIDRRQHTEVFKGALNQLDAGVDVFFSDIMSHQPIEDPLARQLGSRIGILGPTLASDVLDFFYRLEGIRMDLKALGTGEWDNNPSGKADLIREDLALWNETRELGLVLVDKLRSIL